jgi:hypothetical protein
MPGAFLAVPRRASFLSDRLCLAVWVLAPPLQWPCSGSAGGRHPGQGIAPGGAQFENSSLAKQGDMGSKLPPMASQATVRAGALLEVGWTVVANHGGECLR